MIELVQQQQDYLLAIKNLRVHIKIDEGILQAVDNISFEIERGKTVGLVGESGCGKSLTAKAILGINPDNCRTSGEILLYDRDGSTINLPGLNKNSKEIRSIRGGRISMIFQEPMTAFSPLHTIGNQIMENILLHRTNDKKEAEDIAAEMLEMVGIANARRRMRQYPHEFSGGMRQRAMIAMALSCHPDLLIADEPTTALDVTIQAQVLELMKSLQQKLGMAILLITHDLGVISEMCDEVAVMYLGHIVEKAPVREIFYNPKHPYTKGLLKSIPKIGSKGIERLHTIEGNVPLPLNIPAMCRFCDRCAYKIVGLCDSKEPEDVSVSADHSVKCFLYGENGAKEVS